MKSAVKLLVMFSGAIAPPPAPTNLAITGASGGTVADLTPELTWDAVAGATTYTLQYGTASDFTGATEVTGIATNSYTTSSLSNFTTYYFRVAGVNSAGQGAWSSSVSVQTAVYLLLDRFSSDQAAPITTPANVEVGIRKVLIDTGSDISISGGQLVITDPGASWTASVVQWAQTGDVGWTRAAGLCLKCKVIPASGSPTTSKALLGWEDSNAANFPSDHVLYFTAGTNGLCVGAGEAYPLNVVPVGGTTYYLYIILRLNGGAYYFFQEDGSDPFLMWADTSGTVATPKVKSSNNTNTIILDDVAVVQLPAPFATDYGPATLNVASPTATDYTATANQLIDLTLTAPGSITAEAGIIYRKLDASNYWRAYFDTSGAFKVDQVSSGTPTNRISVAGVISAGQTRTIRIICNGSLHDAYTIASGTTTKRGSQINQSHQNTQTTVQPDIGSGWTAANLQSYPHTAAQYDILKLI